MPEPSRPSELTQLPEPKLWDLVTPEHQVHILAQRVAQIVADDGDKPGKAAAAG